MATHSNTLAWETPWTEKPGRLYPMGVTESDMTEQLQFSSSLGPSTLRTLIHLYLRTTLEQSYYHPHFTDGETGQ